MYEEEDGKRKMRSALVHRYGAQRRRRADSPSALSSDAALVLAHPARSGVGSAASDLVLGTGRGSGLRASARPRAPVNQAGSKGEVMELTPQKLQFWGFPEQADMVCCRCGYGLGVERGCEVIVGMRYGRRNKREIW
jgi:hypothetical protein